MAVVRIRDVNKSFRQTRAVRDLDLEVPRGSICGFLGPNGAGKSTTIRMIMSILKPDTGSVEVLGGDALGNKDRIGYLPEERGVYRKMRVGEFLAYMAMLKGHPRQGLASRVRMWLERVGLPGAERQRCEDLSKGMQQKVQFVACIVHEPDLVILDEPFSGLDPVNADVLRHLLEEIHRQGTTVLFSTHVLQQAEQLCDRFVLIDRGRKLLDATLDEMRAQFDPRAIRVEYLPTDDAVDPTQLPGVAAAAQVGRRVWELTVSPQADPQHVLRVAAAAGPTRLVELRQATVEEVFRTLVRTREPA